jgi:YXWGXW repeat-containing protein
MRLRHLLGIAAFSLTSSLMLPSTQAAVFVSVVVAPPELPVYEQPAVPGDGYIWSPGYWAWGGNDYYWVPGTWVLAPEPGYLWTPGYWGFADGNYLWHEGYWGPHVGFYGGVNYGFGYVGSGYAGGYWDHGAFFYNRSVNNIPAGVHVTNVYNKTVINNVTVNHVSYNGGSGGITARPSAEDVAAERDRHLPPIGEQVHHAQLAGSNPALHAASNHGLPAIAATAHAGTFSGPGVIGARGATARVPSQPASQPASQPGAGGPAHTLTTPSHTFNAPPGASPPGAVPRDLKPTPPPGGPAASGAVPAAPTVPQPPKGEPKADQHTRTIPERGKDDHGENR